MSPELKLFAPRTPEALAPRQIEDSGIHSHPRAHQSARFRSWLKHAETNDGAKLTAEINAFCAVGTQ